MARFGVFATAAAVTLLVACSDTPEPPPKCDPIPPQTRDAVDLPDDTVWGFADLHAHPAIELAFEGHLIWGGAVDGAPVNAAELPRIAACPIETHDHDATSPLNRAAGAEVFSSLAQTVGFAHGPVGSVSDSTLVEGWPDARDILHQQMNVGSIRRAYEGGLRLMFASATDDQLLGSVLTGPNVEHAFVPRDYVDYESARRQLDMIVDMVNANSTWMAIVHDPWQARASIRKGQLAIVLALEMNGLREKDVDQLVQDFGVSSIIPIHLTNNDVGGMAANGDIFNASSAAVSELYGAHEPLQYLKISPTPDYGRSLHRPLELGTFDALPVYLSPTDVSYSRYQELCYEPLEACESTYVQSASFIEFGQKNKEGLYCPKESKLDGGVDDEVDCKLDDESVSGFDRIRHLMGSRLMVDVSHMSYASVKDTMAVKLEGMDAYPLIASHGDVAHLCKGSTSLTCTDEAREPLTERSLDADHAREIVKRRGVLGLGTGVDNYDAQTLLAARGGPLLTLVPTLGRTMACAAKLGPKGQATPGCEVALDVDVASQKKSVSIHTLHIQTIGGILADDSHGAPGAGSTKIAPARTVARISLRSPSPSWRYQRHVLIAPLECSTQTCTATVDLGTRDEVVDPESSRACAVQTCGAGASCSTSAHYTLDDVESVTLQWLYAGCDLECQKEWGAPLADRQCSSTWDHDRAPVWTIDEATLSASAEGESELVPMAQLGPRYEPPMALLARQRGSIVLYHRDDRAGALGDVHASGHLLKVSLTSSPDSSALAGATPSSKGANVCVAVRQSSGDECPPVPPPPTGATECPEGWLRLNQRGAWGEGVTLYAFARFPGEASSVCGVDIAVLDWDVPSEPFSLDEVRVEAIEDPVGHWVRRYAAIARHVADGRLGAIAFGTDFNGLNGLTDISELPRPPDAMAPSACGNQTEPQPLAPLRFRDTDGKLGAEVLIEERGLATYGLLADMLAVIGEYPECGRDVRDSLMLSAEATLRAWEAIIEPSKSRPPLPSRSFECDPAGGRGR